MSALQHSIEVTLNQKPYNYATVIDLKTKMNHELMKLIYHRPEFKSSEFDERCYFLLEIDPTQLKPMIDWKNLEAQKKSIKEEILELRNPLVKQNFKQFTKLNYVMYKIFTQEN